MIFCRIRSLQAYNNHKVLTRYERDPNSAHQQIHRKNGGDSAGGNSTTTPSPAASTPNSNRSIASKEMVSVIIWLNAFSTTVLIHFRSPYQWTCTRYRFVKTKSSIIWCMRISSGKIPKSKCLPLTKVS